MMGRDAYYSSGFFGQSTAASTIIDPVDIVFYAPQEMIAIYFFRYVVIAIFIALMAKLIHEVRRLDKSTKKVERSLMFSRFNKLTKFTTNFPLRTSTKKNKKSNM